MSCRHWRSGPCAVCVAVMFAGQGCSGDDLPRQPVSGFVTLDGHPLATGAITFCPDTLEDPDFPVMGAARIKGGYFSIPRVQGLVPGHYEVAIYSRREQEKKPGSDKLSGNVRPVVEERIPAKYNAKSHLAIEINHNAIKEITFRLESD